MGRKIMVVTAAYGAEQVRQAGGQRAMLPVIAGAGQTAWRSAANCLPAKSCWRCPH